MISPVSTSADSVSLSGISSNKKTFGVSFADVLSATENTSADAPKANTSGPAAQVVKDDFERWKVSYFKKGIGNDRREQVEQNSAAFEKIVDKAVSQGAYSDPQAFLRSLSKPELEALQRIHCLADPITPEGLSKEGALNLLYSPDQAKDIDHDGFQMVGLAKTWQFPPVDAPENVKQAWAATTATMSEKDVMLLQGSFLPLAGLTPGKDASGGGAYLGPDADYAGLVKKTLANVRLSSTYDQPWQRTARATEINALERFLGNLAAA